MVVRDCCTPLPPAVLWITACACLLDAPRRTRRPVAALMPRLEPRLTELAIERRPELPERSQQILKAAGVRPE